MVDWYSSASLSRYRYIALRPRNTPGDPPHWRQQGLRTSTKLHPLRREAMQSESVGATYQLAPELVGPNNKSSFQNTQSEDWLILTNRPLTQLNCKEFRQV